MEMTLLDGGRLRICLSPVDMDKYDLTCESIDYDSTETRRALWEMFDEAKHKTGFDAAQGRICIRVYPEKSGGCEIYITKLGNVLPSPEYMNYVKQTEVTLANTSSVYSFTSLDELLRACDHLRKCGYSGESSAGAADVGGKTRYFLSVSSSHRPHYDRSCEYSTLAEFGTLCPGEYVQAFLSERCRVICENNAVEILSKLF